MSGGTSISGSPTAYAGGGGGEKILCSEMLETGGRRRCKCRWTYQDGDNNTWQSEPANGSKSGIRMAVMGTDFNS